VYVLRDLLRKDLIAKHSAHSPFCDTQDAANGALKRATMDLVTVRADDEVLLLGTKVDNFACSGVKPDGTRQIRDV
jgi:hypothetical protein